MLRTGRTVHALCVLLSIALHAALLLGLLHIVRHGEPTGDTPLIHVTLAAGTESVSDGAERKAPTSEDLSAATSVSAPEPSPALDPAPALESEPEPETTVAVAATEVEPEPEPRESDSRRPVEPTDPREAAAVADASNDPIPSSPEPDSAEPAQRTDPPALREATDPVRAAVAPRPAAAKPVVTASVEMAPAQADLLETAATDWASDIDPDSLPSAARLEAADGSAYTVAFSRRPAQDDMDLEQVIATVTTQRDGATLTAELRLTRLAFSSFAQLVDRWDSRVQIHDDEIDGRFHANSEIYIDHSGGVQPTFHGKVTTSRGINTSHSDRRVRRDEVFLGGLETRVRRIVLPRGLDPEGRSHVHRFDEDTRIVFHEDGRYSFAPLATPEHVRERSLPDAPAYLIAHDKAALHVSGVVNGRVLVYSPDDIVIEDDLVYAVDPFVDDESDDYLGLASERSVEIAPPHVTGAGDLRVQAAVYAKGRFAVSRYRSRGPATLNIDGSVTAGSLTATEPRYRTRIRFDPRFETARPPGFPMTERYELTARDVAWTRR